MKRHLLTLALVLFAAVSAKAINYNDACREAWFLTDKMAYELDLTQEQYNRAYQINLDYFLSINSVNDIDSYYWRFREADLRCILYDWQYRLYALLDYFVRPIRWVRSSWFFPVLNYYRSGYYYFGRPTVYVSYHGGMWHHRRPGDISPYDRYRPTPPKGHHQGMRGYYDTYNHGGRPATHRPNNHGGYNGHHGNSNAGNSGFRGNNGNNYHQGTTHNGGYGNNNNGQSGRSGQNTTTNGSTRNGGHQPRAGNGGRNGQTNNNRSGASNTQSRRSFGR